METKRFGLPPHIEDSLVGVTIDYSFGRAFSGSSTIKETIPAVIKKIRKSTQTAHRVGGTLCTMLLAELTAYYSTETYYPVIKSCIEMRRYRIHVLEYLKLSVDERAIRIESLFKRTFHSEKERDLLLDILGYFLSTYPSRTGDFKKYLSKEELLTKI